jgi:hypothetical protein
MRAEIAMIRPTHTRPGPRPSDLEMAQFVALLEARGLLEVYTDDRGQEAYRLTADGIRVGNMLAMVEGEDADLVLDALLSLPD